MIEQRMSKQPITRQTMRIFELLAADARPVSATIIGHRLDILPQAVYRAAKPLVQKGLVREATMVNSQPKYYYCVPLNQARVRYAYHAQAEFDEWFRPVLQKSSKRISGKLNSSQV